MREQHKVSPNTQKHTQWTQISPGVDANWLGYTVTVLQCVVGGHV